jgi:hypothetical protein
LKGGYQGWRMPYFGGGKVPAGAGLEKMLVEKIKEINT